ncbi:uncharacterized protein [Branchiostoma lanceolatum]|uniref:uncharacterized protein n=1 Tax=Branchiostoma lanceolatum TaxID=7740 RepID=UPI003453A51E
MDNICLAHKKCKRQKHQVKYNLEKLDNPSTQVQYKQSLANQLSNIAEDNNPNIALTTVLKSMETAAANILGVLKNTNGKQRHHTEDPVIMKLSEKQKALRLRIYQTGHSEDRKPLRTERNKILREISKQLKNQAMKRADELKDEITATDDSRKMFKAARAFKVCGPPPSLSVQNSDGQFILTDKGKADAIREWFKEQFTDRPEGEHLEPFQGEPRPLKDPIKDDEIKKAIKTLSNGRSPCPDGVSDELFKHGSDSTSHITAIINGAFEHHYPIEAMGQGTLN